MSRIRIAQLFNLRTSSGTRHRYQNYFIGQEYTYLGAKYDFAPFQVSGAMASLGGDNETVQVLFPNLEVVLRLVEEGDGNRLSELTLTTLWLNATGAIANQYEDYYVGSGAGFNDDTVELRFRSAMDSVGSNFPARTLTSQNVGILPLNAELYLR
jgi:phage-related protein